MELTVTNAHVSRFRAAVAIVTFSDGHKVFFTENGGGWGEPTAVEAIRLDHYDTTVAEYFSPHQYPINRLPFGWRPLAQGYTHQQVVAYLKAAYDHVAAAAPSKLADAWRIICLAGRDIDDLVAAHPVRTH